ncbi:MAG: hypothetical protein ACI84R_000819 [Candidatus Azotimanducaceae bacterium]|jgi:hypothetical protein
MFGTSTIIFAFLGVSLVSILVGSEDRDAHDEIDDDIALQNDDSAEEMLEVIPTETLILNTETPEVSLPLSEETSTTEPFTESATNELQEFFETDEFHNTESADIMLDGLVAGGPGDVLTGGDGVNNFVVTLAEFGANPTVIEDLFFLSEEAELDTEQSNPVAEVIWFTDSAGDLLSRNDMLEENIRFEENEDIPSVSLHFEHHQTLSIQGLTLAEFSDNSLVIGNFGIFDT